MQAACSSSSTTSSAHSAPTCAYGCDSGPVIDELCPECQEHRSDLLLKSEQSSCQVCHPEEEQEIEAGTSFQTRYTLPAPAPHLRAMISVVLQDLDRSIYAIPYIPTPLIELITQYASTAMYEAPAHAVVCRFPDENASENDALGSANCEKAEFHSARDLRMQFLRESEDDIRNRFAIAYFSLRGEEMQRLREMHAVNMPPADFNLFQDRLFWKYFSANKLSSHVIRLAANRMRELLFSISQTAAEQRTQLQQDIWNQCGEWGKGKHRDRMLLELSYRNMDLFAPLPELLPQWLGDNSDKLYSLTEYVPESGELVVTSCVAPLSQKNDMKHARWNYRYSNKFWQKCAPSTTHTATAISHQDGPGPEPSKYEKVEPLPF